MMASNKETARTAGVLYLIVVLTGILSLGYVPSQINVQGDAATTLGNIAASATLFRVGIVASLVCYTAFAVLPLVLYKLLGPVSKAAAVLMVAFAVISVPIAVVNVVHKLDVLSLVSGAGYLRAFTTDQLHARVMLSLDSYSSGILVTKIFWGLWLFPFGYLVFKSGILPRILGVLLMLGCVGYLIDFAGHVFVPSYLDTVIQSVVTLPSFLGEVGICLWMLIMGAKERTPQAA